MGFFDGIGSALASGGLSLLGGILQNQSQSDQAQSAQAASAQQAQENRDWQERMSNTSYQRAVKDMAAAGLNPMLAYQSGGAGTPSGATGLGFQAQVGNPLGSAVEAFQRSRSTSADVELKGSQTDVNKAEEIVRNATIDKVKQETATSAAAEASAKANALNQLSQAKLNSANEAKIRAETAYIDAQRAEAAAKQPAWNILQGVTQKIKDISENSSAENIHRARKNLESLPGIPRPSRTIEIIGNPGVFK